MKERRCELGEEEQRARLGGEMGEMGFGRAESRWDASVGDLEAESMHAEQRTEERGEEAEYGRRTAGSKGEEARKRQWRRMDWPRRGSVTLQCSEASKKHISESDRDDQSDDARNSYGSKKARTERLKQSEGGEDRDGRFLVRMSDMKEGRKEEREREQKGCIYRQTVNWSYAYSGRRDQPGVLI